MQKLTALLMAALCLAACGGDPGSYDPGTAAGDPSPHGSTGGDPAALGPSRGGGEAAPQLYASTSSIWSSHQIPVCWEGTAAGESAAQASARGQVRDAVARSWSQVVNVDFTGWGFCASNAKGIRIQILDDGTTPQTKALGRNLDGVRNGMVLDFTFENWSPTCKTSLRFCIETVAIHEFGHALGFAHEQNRSDTPMRFKDGSCDPQGSNGDLTVGAWDLDSVMNYCNPDWDGSGQLSATDIRGVQQLYGSRSNVFFYKAAGGVGNTYRISDAGVLQYVSTINGFSSNWTHVVGANNGALFFYDSATGAGWTSVIDSAGQ